MLEMVRVRAELVAKVNGPNRSMWKSLTHISQYLLQVFPSHKKSGERKPLGFIAGEISVKVSLYLLTVTLGRVFLGPGWHIIWFVGDP